MGGDDSFSSAQARCKLLLSCRWAVQADTSAGKPWDARPKQQGGAIGSEAQACQGVCISKAVAVPASACTGICCLSSANTCQPGHFGSMIPLSRSCCTLVLSSQGQVHLSGGSRRSSWC